MDKAIAVQTWDPHVSKFKSLEPELMSGMCVWWTASNPSAWKAEMGGPWNSWPARLVTSESIGFN